MNIRSIKRQIAKARIKALGGDRINKNFSIDRDGVPTWKRALYGKSGEAAHKAQMNLGKLILAREQGRKVTGRRKLKRVGV